MKLNANIAMIFNEQLSLLIRGDNPQEHEERKRLHQYLAERIGKYIHPNIYGSLAGRSATDCILNVIIGKVINKKTILKLDVAKAFLNVDVFRLASLLKRFFAKAAIPEEEQNALINQIFRHFEVKNGKGVRFRGLAQGDILSSLLFSIFMTPVFNRFGRRYKVFGYVDDNHIILDKKEDAIAAEEHFIECLCRNGYYREDEVGNILGNRQLFLNDDKRGLSAPDEDTSVLGLIITKDFQLLPRPDRSISTFLDRADKISKKLFKMKMNDPSVGYYKLLSNLEAISYRRGVAASNG
ncbi:MAG: hypothetical protein HQK52_20345 [Oligoflexia bacterium]|nr:hypothetical protein [Oligoflexia bacterium]